jgi:hypothetical protein
MMLDLLATIGNLIARIVSAVFALWDLVTSYFFVRDAFRAPEEPGTMVPRDPLPPAAERALAEAEERRARTATDQVQ